MSRPDSFRIQSLLQKECSHVSKQFTLWVLYCLPPPNPITHSSHVQTNQYQAARVLQAPNLDLLMRVYTLLATAANTRQEQSGFAIKAQVCGVSLLLRSTSNTKDSKAAGESRQGKGSMPAQRLGWYCDLDPHIQLTSF